MEKEHIDDCVANYSGSAPGMEQEGAKRIFGRFDENRGLKYTHFYGDGDSKSFKVVENIYPDKKVIKYECIGHYQKRVGNRFVTEIETEYTRFWWNWKFTGCYDL